MRAWWAAIPLAWAALLVFHPAPDPGDMYGSPRDEPGRWLAVHVGTLFFIGPVGGAVLRLVAGLPGPAPKISRVAAPASMVFYGAGGAINGIAVGVLVQHANDAPEGDRDAVARAIQALVDDFLSIARQAALAPWPSGGAPSRHSPSSATMRSSSTS